MFHCVFIFQFKYCTIKRRTNYCYSHPELNFNSSIVRLKAFTGFTHCVHGFGFQFKYCTIKRWLRGAEWTEANNFNSSIVRLKVSITDYYNSALPFQFKYCTIKSPTNWVAQKDYHQFQFKYCTIKRLSC